MTTRAVLLLAMITSLARGQKPEPIALVVRSMIPDRVLHVHVSASGGAQFGLAVWNGAPGEVSQKGSDGTGTTPLIVNVSNTLGRIRLTVAPGETPIRVTLLGDTARLPKALGLGRALDVSRDSLGNVVITTASSTKP